MSDLSSPISTIEYSFARALLKELDAHSHQVQTNNIDHIRFPPGVWEGVKVRVKDAIFPIMRKIGFVYVSRSTKKHSDRYFYIVIDNIEKFQLVYNLLQDRFSQEMLISLLAFKILGYQHVKLSLNNEKYWDKIDLIKNKLLKERNIMNVKSTDIWLDLYDLHAIDLPMRLFAHKMNVLNTFLLEQYRYDRGENNISVEPGDIVIDAGGCWGDTALYFAYKTGIEGKVFCFEFAPENIKVLNENININNLTQGRVEVITAALWDKSSEDIAYYEQGPSTKLSPNSDQATVIQTMTVDDFVKQRVLEHVDFIKMDIEGSELKALHGAEQTIRRFRPKLAIAAYHKNDDLISLPIYLKSLNLGYEFFLDHFTIHNEETILFARPS
jgi:FkbM family methyltransferase